MGSIVTMIAKNSRIFTTYGSNLQKIMAKNKNSNIHKTVKHKCNYLKQHFLNFFNLWMPFG